jgi:[protein-PII] uridylyltransferase
MSLATSGLRLHPAVVAAREELARGLEKIKRQHASGSPSVQVCAHITDFLEHLVLSLYQAALEELAPSERQALEGQVALAAHSGFGRREMAPYSDVDVMLLHPFANEQAVVPLVRRFTQNLYDTGIDLGFSTRTPVNACQVALEDATVATSLCEARLLTGSTELFERFEHRFKRMAVWRWKRLVASVEAARRDERNKYGETVFLLEPNIKRSRGGLRDLQLIRWIGFLRYGLRDFGSLEHAGWLTKAELRALRRARDFLLWLRNDLHFHSGKAADLLDRTEQLRLAEGRGYPAVEGLLPVEQFMREYFQHTTEVGEIATQFAASARPKPPLRWLFDPLVTHRFERDFRVGPTSIAVTRRGLEKIRGNLLEVLRLLDIANLYNKGVALDTWQTIRAAMLERGAESQTEQLAPEITLRFRSLLAQPARLAESLRMLHELRVLEQIIPGMTHARGLLQFNAYHRYTVDEHSLRVVEQLTALQTASGTPGEVYRGLKNKGTLHLAALIHDLGKGYAEDHSEVGLRLAAQTAARLELSEQDGETLKFLVHKHLRMSHLAQQHDISDEQVVVNFAVEVGTPERLKMLYLLTLADLAGVGPGVLNEWKQQLLTDLYDHTLTLISSDSPSQAAHERIRQRRSEILGLAQRLDSVAWWETQIISLPTGCLFAGPPPQIVSELDRLRKLPHRDAVAWGRHLPDRKVVEYTVGTYEEITPGIFHKLTGALTSNRQQILSAEINTLAEGLVLDRFHVQDKDFAGPPPQERIDEICRALVAALKDDSNRPPTFRKLWHERNQTAAAAIQHLPTRVTIDNSTAERFTIVAVFAYDRMGLLYAISRALFELGLSVSKAKIGTRLDQVVDVFYVTDQRGRKIDDERRLVEIRERSLAAIEEMPTADA